MAIDYTKLKPYVITLTRDTHSKVDYVAMKKSGVSGVVVEGGYLFELPHKRVTIFRNPLAYKQVDEALTNKLPIGWLMYGRAKTTKEAQDEIYQLSFLIRKYSPTLGVWIVMQINGGSIQNNDNILNTYKTELTRLGLKGKIGIQCKESFLSNITWSAHQKDWLLWTIKHVTKLSDLERLLDPAFFDIEEKYV
jgi:hypothetical protein